MRLLLFTGKGGVGKSTHALAVAVASARAGRRTLVVSTDAAHSLADALGVPVGAEPTEVEPNLHVQHVDAQRRFEESWAEVQSYLLSVLEVVGVDPVAAEELTVLPGAEEVLSLLELRAHARSGRWDVVVVDCAPTAETLRLLALPEALGWYMTRILPTQRTVMKALRPVLTKAAGVPMPQDAVFDAVVRLHDELSEVHELLTGPGAGVRIVLTPEEVVLAEARRAYTLLSLYGHRVDGVVVNRVFPTDSEDPWVAGWARAQEAVLGRVRESFAPLPMHLAGYLTHEPVGPDDLAALADATYGGHDPVLSTGERDVFRITRDAQGSTLALKVPLVDPDQVRLARDGDDLVVTVGSYRRLLTLPTSLSRHRVAGARCTDDEVQVRFVPQDGAEPAPYDDSRGAR
ncbi:MAG: ArsA family ATPase [Nocardioides sp.]|uniref:ArsA family ATPase n=1 Tax=Nocardioides sp. TaxID=35761 RepID=UPI003F09D704